MIVVDRSLLSVIVAAVTSLLVTSEAAWAQSVKERVRIPGGSICEVEQKKDETRLKCDNGAWDGVRHNRDGTVDELVKGRNPLTLGLTHTFKARRVTRVFESEKDPLPMPPGLPLQDIAADLPQASADNPVAIDVNIVWSQAVQNALGGKAQAEARAALIAAVGTQTYANSGVPWVSLRLVGAKLVGYTEDMSVNGLTWAYYSSYGNPTYGYELKVFRATTGADLTQLLTTDDPCGVGYLSCSGAGCLSTAEVGCSVSNLTSPHEMGHNEGMHHNNLEGNAPNCGVSENTSYNCGFNWGPARDIMAYSGGPRVRHVSSATVLWVDAGGTSYATGNAFHDNARVLVEQAARIAAQNNPPALTGLPPSTVQKQQATPR